MSTLTAKEKKLFPIHDPMSHVEIELSCLNGILTALQQIVIESTEEIEEHTYVAIEAIVEKGVRDLEHAQTMLHAAMKIAEREKAGASYE